MNRTLPVLLTALVTALVTSGCSKEGCLGGEADCKMPSPCQKVALSCDASQSMLAVKRIESASERPKGKDALGATGDVLMSNAFTQVVIGQIGKNNYIDPNGGSILDLASPGVANDGINNIFQAVGILPGDSAKYTDLTIIDERPARVAVQVRGTLDGRPDQPIYTRYELTPCDRGVRVRTEIFNGSPDTQMWTVTDGYYWSQREAIPFAPGAGSGFTHAPFGLLTINDAFRKFPFMAASTHTDEQASYAVTSCTDAQMEGFHSAVVSSAGLPRKVIAPRGFQVFERYIALAEAGSAAGAIDTIWDIRKQVLGEQSVKVTGKVERAMALALNGERETSVIISEGTLADAAEKRIPWTQVVPDVRGQFTARVPSGKNLVVEVHSFGRKVLERELSAVSADADLGTLTLPSTSQVRFNVNDVDTNAPLDAEIFIVPADEATKTATAGSFHGQFGTCTPWLGPPPGASPACNRVLVRAGGATAEVPVGAFHVYAFHGPFWSLARQTVTLTPATTTLSFRLKQLFITPPGTLSADLHVHGAASFDSSIPDTDRVLAFAASDLGVIVATDHDVVYDYSTAVQQLGLSSRISTITGVETTGHIPFLRIPNFGFPLVIGHYNMWPLRYDPSAPRNGGPQDELVEPGELFDRTKPLFTGLPLIELNHPWADTEFGRDLGFPRALSLSLLQDLPKSDDGTSAGIYVRSPKGGYRNNQHDAQEVMNGSNNDALMAYRAFWFYTLNQGELKTGTANSDSHSLADNTVGMPRNLVYANTQPGPGFNADTFNRAILDGRVLGTNGPIIELTLEGETGTKTFSMEPIKPKADARLFVKVSAAPWIPVTEIRFIVNGLEVKKITQGLKVPPDALGSADPVRYEGEIALPELLAGVTGDAWLVVEAGTALPLVADLGGSLDGSPDGVPDTGDNNNDGTVNKADIAPDRDYGPLSNGPEPKEGDARFHFAQITSNGFPFGFTNPFILDRDGDGKFTAPGVKGGRP